MLLDGRKGAQTQSRQDRNYAYLLEVPYSSTFQLLQYGNEKLTTTANARSLGVVLDDNTLIDVHVSDICRSSFNQLRNLSKIRKYLTQEKSEIAVHAFITSKLVFCNSLLYGCRKMQFKKLQYVQNTAARIVTQTRKFVHITPVLIDLHWLPVSYRIVVCISIKWWRLFGRDHKNDSDLDCWLDKI